MKKALITWITGQDGSYLTELLLSKWYEVHGIKRRSSSFNTDRIDHLFHDIHTTKVKLFLHYGDMTDSANLIQLVSEIKPDEIYNLAAQSHVKVSFDMPEYTWNVDAIGTLRLLEAVKSAGLGQNCKIYQASTSELYGGMEYNMPVDGYTEESLMHPRSPYGVAKLYGLWIMRNYRESYGMFACNGILFNHESPRRGETFVTRKITIAVAKISLWLQDRLYLGNLDARRDRWHARDYVEAMRLMLQQDTPEDYVIATGETYTVREFVNRSFQEVWITIERRGEWVDEKWYHSTTGVCLVEIDPMYFRPSEVELLLWNPAKAKQQLGRTPTTSVQDMCKEMVASDLRICKKEQLIAQAGLSHQE